MKGFLEHLIVENDQFEQKLGYEAEYKVWGLEPHQMLALLMELTPDMVQNKEVRRLDVESQEHCVFGVVLTCVSGGV
ncbi:MAG: hypothetical protein Q4A61_01015 [Porphyromonadaceae bacterium]|nr:hypothetical protein [Porphyromonadaceae bacterium]